MVIPIFKPRIIDPKDHDTQRRDCILFDVLCGIGFVLCDIDGTLSIVGDVLCGVDDILWVVGNALSVVGDVLWVVGDMLSVVGDVLWEEGEKYFAPTVATDILS